MTNFSQWPLTKMTNLLLEPHNLHQVEGPDSFGKRDPTLRRIASEPLRFVSPLVGAMPLGKPGTYTLVGGRQVGKTTILKQSMLALLDAGTDPAHITYLTGEVIPDDTILRRELVEACGPPERESFVFLDEVTYVRDWDRAVKFLADAGALEKTALVLSGSDLILIQDALKRLPGRRGRAPHVDFHAHPLTFLEFCLLRDRTDSSAILELADADPRSPIPSAADSAAIELLYGELRDYLLSGGYLTAINDLERNGRVDVSTLRIYSDWIRGDILRLNRNEVFLREVLQAILTRYGSQVTWNALSRDLSINHPKTVADYVGLLERMDAAVVVPALREDRLSAAPKKARKLYFSDPFIRNAVAAFLSGDPVGGLAAADIEEDRKAVAGLVESLVLTHSRRFAPTYYIKSRGEVDCAYVRDGRFWPIEVKWGQAWGPKDVRQVARYPNGLIAARTREERAIKGTPVLPIPVVLLRLSQLADSGGR